MAAIWFAATAAAAVETSSSTGPAAALCTSDAVLVGLVAARAVTGALAGEPCPRARAAWKLQPLAAGMDNRQVIAVACLVELPQIACTQLHWGSRWHSEQTPQVQCASDELETVSLQFRSSTVHRDRAETTAAAISKSL